jgi:MFS family permease
LAGSGLALGITNALQFGPLVFFGLYGGVIADRFDRRRLLIATQSALALLAGTIRFLAATHLIQLWMIWAAALLLGLIISIDKPALLAFVKDLVGEAELPNAVSSDAPNRSAGTKRTPCVRAAVRYGTATSTGITSSAGSILGATLGGLAVAYAPVTFLKVFLGCVLIAAAAKTIGSHR